MGRIAVVIGLTVQIASAKGAKSLRVLDVLALLLSNLFVAHEGFSLVF